jgi:Tol biopolymer transport system component
VAGRLVRTAAVSPDGEHVIFQVAQTGAYLLDLRDGSMRCVLADPTAEEFAWSPDGHRVAFHSRRDGQWAIWIMDHAAT